MIVFLGKRTLICLVVTVLGFLPFYVKMAVIGCVQVANLGYVLVCRPFESLQDNLTEIVNETIYCVLCLSLFGLNEESDWSSALEISYFSILMSNNAIFAVISVVFLIINLKSKPSTPKSSSKINNDQDPQESHMTKLKSSTISRIEHLHSEISIPRSQLNSKQLYSPSHSPKHSLKRQKYNQNLPKEINEIKIFKMGKDKF